MTIEHAISIILDDSLYNPEVAEMAIDALKKQNPVHPVNHINLGCVCKSCGWIVERQDHYCPGCGQRIDWSWMENKK